MSGSLSRVAAAVLVAIGAASSYSFADSGVEISHGRRTIEEERGGFSITLTFDATFRRNPPPRWGLSVRARCVVSARNLVDSSHVMDMLTEVAAGDTKTLDVILFNPFGSNRLPERPSTCEYYFLFGKRFSRSADVIKVYCDQGFSGGALREGKCVGAAESSRQQEVDRRERDISALTELADLCGSGNMDSCLDLGNAYQDGIGTRKNIAKADELFVKSCKGGGAFACDRVDAVARAYLSGDDDRKKNAIIAAKLFRIACDGGSSGGCTHLGGVLVQGIGVAKDLEQAANLLKRACMTKNVEGCEQLVKLGKVFEKGDKTAADPRKAGSMYQAACDAGVALGCQEIGLMWLEGRGVPRNVETAEVMLRKSCTIEFQDGCASLTRIARMYESGSDVEKNEAMAVEVYRYACSSRMGSSCAALGAMYELGRGVRRDRSKARQAYQQACDAGIQVACDALKQLYDVK